jgi:hypothetical protein
MTLTILDNLEQGTDAWFDARRGIVTASVVGKLLTPTLKVADNDTSRSLTETLIAERISGFTEDGPMTSDMFRGVYSEPYARDIYSTYYTQAVECGFMLREEDGWQLGYSPDGLVGDGGLLEVKSPRAKTHLRTILADEVPAHYVAQLQGGLLVSGREWIDFCSYCGGLPLYVKRVFPDPAWFDAITEACRVFETNAARIVADYRTRVAGLPTTERINFNLEMVI